MPETVKVEFSVLKTTEKGGTPKVSVKTVRALLPPEGPAMVEIEGIDEENLDAALGLIARKFPEQVSVSLADGKTAQVPLKQLFMALVQMKIAKADQEPATPPAPAAPPKK